MTYSTLMVQLELEHPNDARLQIAGDLAERFVAKLIGIAACEQSPRHTTQTELSRGDSSRRTARRSQSA